MALTHPFAHQPVTAYPSRLSSLGAGVFAAGSYSSGVFSAVHRSTFKTLRNSFASFSAAIASWVKVRRMKASSAAFAHSVWGLVLLAMTSLCTPTFDKSA